MWSRRTQICSSDDKHLHTHTFGIRSSPPVVHAVDALTTRHLRCLSFPFPLSNGSTRAGWLANIIHTAIEREFLEFSFTFYCYYHHYHSNTTNAQYEARHFVYSTGNRFYSYKRWSTVHTQHTLLYAFISEKEDIFVFLHSNIGPHKIRDP